MTEVTPQKPNFKILGAGAAALVLVMGSLIYLKRSKNDNKPTNADEAKVAQQGAKARAQGDAKAAGVQQKKFGEDLKFDSQGNLLGAGVSEGDLPQNKTLDGMAEKQAKANRPAAGDDVNAGIDSPQDGGTYGNGSRGPRSGFGDSNPQAREQNRVDHREELELASQPMLAYSTERTPAGATSAPQPTAKAPQGGDSGSFDPAATEARMIGQLQQAGVLPNQGQGRKAGASEQPMRSRPGSLADMRVNKGPEYIIPEGKSLDCVLTHQVESSFNDSPAVLMVARDFMSADGKHVLFPAGTKIMSVAGKTENIQQARLFIASHRALFPNQESAYFPERQMPLGMNPDGSYGVEGNVNRHFWLQYGAAIMLGVVEGLGAAAAGPQTYSANTGIVTQTAQQAALASTSKQFTEVTKRILDRYANVVPTISLPRGARVKVYFTEDVRVNEYMPTSDLRWVNHASR